MKKEELSWTEMRNTMVDKLPVMEDYEELAMTWRDGGGRRCSERSYVMHGRAATAGKLVSLPPPAKMHFRINVLKQLFEPSYQQTMDTFIEVASLD